MYMKPTRWQRLILFNPFDKYSYYEAAKHGITLQDSIDLAKSRNVDINIVKDGYLEYEKTKD